MSSAPDILQAKLLTAILDFGKACASAGACANDESIASMMAAESRIRTAVEHLVALATVSAHGTDRNPNTPAARFTIYGEPASKANSRKLVQFGERPAIVKSDKGLAYERDALRQIPSAARLRLQGPVAATMRIYYASERPDLDESLVLDVLQDRWTGKGDRRVLVQAGVYGNDRQVREKHVFHAIDKRNPRTEIEVTPLHPQQAAVDFDDLPF